MGTKFLETQNSTVPKRTPVIDIMLALGIRAEYFLPEAMLWH